MACRSDYDSNPWRILNFFGFLHPLSNKTNDRGALAEQGQVEEGLVRIHKGLAKVQALGIETVGSPKGSTRKICKRRKRF